ncbi:facilitated trehalose transporter Tret1-like [Maniola jurtina]|uniref:facilitated trehalose transporter Tret1-like n=1 Tax=Maniola jurtina TaxID=191418 RepID=UPI001E68D4F4|nr:facilitated trehalose transporter Tret1-like [Maniola jurtina]XP_045765672.1 facilitated trehalose transporter Tret1-like [Maniola jurtina]
MFMGAPTVLIPQLRKEANSTDVVTPEMASWLSSMSAYSGIPWGLILPLLAYRFGRKHILVLISVSVLIGNIIFYCSTSMTELIVSQALQGILAASITTITIMVMSEYTSPKYRGVLLAVKSATFYWGVWISNAIGTFYHWRNIGIVIFVCSIYNLSSIFYKESPYWLATKGRFEECANIHRWLKGTGEDSEEELRKLISSQQEHLSMKAEIEGRANYRKYIKFLNVLRCESFYKPFAYAIFPTCLYHFSGKMAYTVYAIDIIKKLTSSETMAYGGMLVLDAVTVLGMYLGCGLAKIARRRTQLLVFSSMGISFLFVLSIYLYMVNLNILSENKFISLFLLTAFSLSIGSGPIIISACCAAELCPLRYRSYFLCCLSLFNSTLMATVVKFSPILFKYSGAHGAFLFYAISSSIFLFLIYKYMPETKDQTIQEIQDRMTRRDGRGQTNRETLLLKETDFTQ